MRNRLHTEGPWRACKYTVGGTTVGTTGRGYGDAMTRKRSALSQDFVPVPAASGTLRRWCAGPGAYGRRRARRSITRSVFRLFR